MGNVENPTPKHNVKQLTPNSNNTPPSKPKPEENEEQKQWDAKHEKRVEHHIQKHTHTNYEETPSKHDKDQ